MTGARGAVRYTLAFTIGLAASVLTVMCWTTGAGFASQIPDRLISTLSRNHVLSLLRQTSGAEFSWQFMLSDRRHASLARWTDLGVPISGVWPRAQGVQLGVKGPARGKLASMVPIPVAIENADRLGQGTVLLVTNVPEHTALSVGKPLGAGAWLVPTDLIERLGIISYALPPKRALTFDLLTADGRVLSSARVPVDIS